MKLDLNHLFEMFQQIEESGVLNELQGPASSASRTIPIELFTVELTEKLGEAKDNNASREELSKMIQNATGITGKGKVREKLEALGKVSQKYEKENDVSKLMAQVTILSSMYKMLSSFQASPAGFLNEAFMSVFYGTEQVKVNPQNEEGSKTELADVYTDLGLPVSLKTIKKDGNVGGSKKLLEQALEKSEKVLFHIYEKIGEDPKAPQAITFYEFVVTKENISLLTKRDYEQLQEGKDAKDILVALFSHNRQDLKNILSNIDKYNLPDEETFLNTLEKIDASPEEKEAIKDTIENERTRRKEKESAKARFELKAKEWKSLTTGQPVTVSIDPALTNQIIENKIKLLNNSIVELALHLKQLSSNLKQYCFSTDPDKTQFGDKAVEASEKVFPETKEAVSSIKQ